MNIYGVGGEKHRVIGKVTLPLKFKGLDINYAFFIIGDLQYIFIAFVGLFPFSLMYNSSEMHEIAAPLSTSANVLTPKISKLILFLFMGVIKFIPCFLPICPYLDLRLKIGAFS
jgi:hypothetical protein